MGSEIYAPASDGCTSSGVRHVFAILLPTLQNLQDRSWWHIVVNVLTAIPVLLLTVTIPVIDVGEESDSTDLPANLQQPWDRWLLLLQVFTTPQFFLVNIWLGISTSHTFTSWGNLSLYCILGSAVSTILIFLTSTSTCRPRWYSFIGSAGFVASAFWLSTIADEVVSLLKAFGVILHVSDTILGFTVFAVGNSVDDLIADITVAQHGHPVMALGACFGGPLLKILLGLGASGAYVTARDARLTGTLRPIELNVDLTLVVSITVLMVTLIGLVIGLRIRQWQMGKMVGIALIGVWIAITGANLGVELMA